MVLVDSKIFEKYNFNKQIASTRRTSNVLTHVIVFLEDGYRIYFYNDLLINTISEQVEILNKYIVLNIILYHWIISPLLR